MDAEVQLKKTDRWKRKEGDDEGKQTLDMKIYPVVSVGTNKPP